MSLIDSLIDDYFRKNVKARGLYEATRFCFLSSILGVARNS